MCGRYTLKTPVEELAESFGVERPLPEVSPRYNVAPSQEVLAVVNSGGQRSMEMLRWGLVPYWSRDGKPGPINARAETVAEKPSFRKAFRERRCLIPADGYYEWKKEAPGPKRPYYFTVRDGEPFAFAGIFEVWRGNGEGEMETSSCALITTRPNALAAEVHDRMPVILPRKDYEEWLDPAVDAEDLLRLLAPYPVGEMESYPVSRRVNNPASDDERLLKRETT